MKLSGKIEKQQKFCDGKLGWKRGGLNDHSISGGSSNVTSIILVLTQLFWVIQQHKSSRDLGVLLSYLSAKILGHDVIIRAIRKTTTEYKAMATPWYKGEGIKRGETSILFYVH